MTFISDVNIIKHGDRLNIMIRQPYYPRGIGRGLCRSCGLKNTIMCKARRDKSKTPSYRWRFAGWFSLKELQEIEKYPYATEESE